MKLKKIIALSGVAVLVLLYIITFISAITTSPASPELFKACIMATFAVPVLLYAFLLVYKLSKDHADAAKKELDEAIKNGAANTNSETENESDI